MKKFNKLMAIALSVAMCLSLLPMSVFAADLKDSDEYRDWGPHTVDKPEEKTDDEFADKIKDPLQNNLDKEAIEDSEEAAKNLNDAAYDAIYGKDESTTDPDAPAEDHTADDVMNGIPDKYKEDETPSVPEEPKEDDTPSVPEPPKDDDSVLENADKAADAAETFQKAVTDAVTVEGEKDDEGNSKTVDEVVGEVVRDKDGAIDEEKSSGKALEIAKAAETAQTGAEDAKQALTDAQGAVENRDQAALDKAKGQAETAYNSADTAFKAADAAYNTAKDTVDAAQKAYDDAVAALKAAGYKLDGDNSEGSENLKEIEAALSEAKAAVETAQTQLAAAEKTRNEAEMQRDYAKVYAVLATALGSKYTEADFKDFDNGEEWLKDEANVAKLQPLLDAMETLLEVSAKTQYGEGDNAVKREDLDLNELAFAYQLLWSTGDDYYDALVDFSYIYRDKNDPGSDWTSWNEQKRQEQMAKVKELEEKYDIKTGDSEDLLYKVYKYAIDKNVQNKDTLGWDTDTLARIAGSINQYWQIEKFLDHDKPEEDPEGTWKELGEMNPITFQYKLKTNPGNEWKYQTYEVTVTLKEDQDGNKSITVNDKTYTPESPEWDAFTALIRRQTATQIDSVKEEVFGQTKHTLPITVNGKLTTWYSKFDELKYQVSVADLSEIMDAYDNARLLVGYLGLLQYELPLRADEQKYLGSKDLYNAVADQTSPMQMLLSGSQVGLDQLQKEWEAAKANPDSGIPEELKDMSFEELLKSDYAKLVKGMIAAQVAHALIYATEENAKYPEQKALYDVMANMIDKKERAEAAQSELDAAVEAYDKAVTAAEKAQQRLDDLLKKLDDGKTQFAKAVEDAKQQLDDANKALEQAEADKKSAEEKKSAAEADYIETMKLAIAIVPGGSGDGGDGDTGLELDDPAVPLASGPVTRAQFVDYLWRHEGEPASDGVCTFADVAEDHEFVLALAWAEQNGIIEANEDGAFQPDELVTVEAVRAILGSFANVFGGNAVPASGLTTLTGEDGEAVLNCDQVLAEFFGEEYVLPEDFDSLETDTAA